MATVTLTSGTTWTVPSDWDNANNTIDLYGAGGKGRTGSPYDGPGGNGAGGGAFARLNNFNLTPGATVYIRIAPTTTGSNGATTWFNKNANSQPSSISDGGVAAGGAGDRIGGSAASSIGDVKYDGGNGVYGGEGGGNGGVGGYGGGCAGSSGAGSGQISGGGLGGNGGNGGSSGGGNGSLGANYGSGGGGGGGNGGKNPAGVGGNGRGGAIQITYTPLVPNGRQGYGIVFG